MGIVNDSSLLRVRASDFRIIYGPCAAKKIQSEFLVAMATAWAWLSGNIPESRQAQIAAGLILELRRQAAQRAEIETRLLEIVDAWCAPRKGKSEESGARVPDCARLIEDD